MLENERSLRAAAEARLVEAEQRVTRAEAEADRERRRRIDAQAMKRK